jgi:hypothetical protein
MYDNPASRVASATSLMAVLFFLRTHVLPDVGLLLLATKVCDEDIGGGRSAEH